MADKRSAVSSGSYRNDIDGDDDDDEDAEVEEMHKRLVTKRYVPASGSGLTFSLSGESRFLSSRAISNTLDTRK